jgi:hydroxymethylpyrimidine pyrophosphatase-like HAD family hydrolase
LRTDPARYLNLAEVSDPILKVSGIGERPADLAACEAELRKELAGRVYAVLSPPHDLDVTHPSADKGQAAVAIAMSEGALMEEVVTVGDSLSDIPMFQAGGLSVAMGQAGEDVRRAAMEVTRSNADNGLAWAIEYVLNGKWSSNAAVQRWTDR